MQNKKRELVERNLKLGDRLFRQLLPTVPKELLELDMTMSQLKIALLLFLNGPLRMSDIASQLEITLPTATSLVDRLVEKEHVIRENQPDDRRIVLCKLSPKGQKAVSQMWVSSRNRTKELLEALDITKLQMLSEVLQAMLEPANYAEELQAVKKS